MSTRSRIGIKNENGSIDSIYCHFDGYPDGVGKVLQENYTNKEKIKKLLELGNLSSLGPEIETNENPTTSEWNTIAYSRDRGESIERNKKENSYSEYWFKKLARKTGCDFAYYFDTDNKWVTFPILY